MPDPAPSASSQQITELLRHRHKPPEWATFAELRAGTGYGVGRDQRIDFFAMNLFPSNRGLSIAYEIKTSRGDFTRELDHPEKRRFAESVATDCYFALPHGMVKPDEVPEGWGLLELNAGGLHRIKFSTQRRIEGWPLWFTFSLARRCSDSPPKLPAAAWRYAMREITDAELLEIAKEAGNRTIETERQRIVDETKNHIFGSSQYQQLLELQREVSRLTDIFDCTPESLRSWSKEQRISALAKHELNDMVYARNALDKIIGRATPPPQGDNP